MKKKTDLFFYNFFLICFHFSQFLLLHNTLKIRIDERNGKGRDFSLSVIRNLAIIEVNIVIPPRNNIININYHSSLSFSDLSRLSTH